MSLPILQHRPPPSPADLVRFFHRTEAMRVGHLAEAAALEVGTAHSNPQLASVRDANNLRDAALPAGVSAAEAVAEVDAHYAARGVRCAYWVTNPSSPPAQTQPLAEHLLASGYRAEVAEILHLSAARSRPIAEVGDLRIIPGRASYRHARQLVEVWAAERWGGNPQLVEAQLLDLDNPQVDVLLALRGDRAVATLGVLSVGDLGRIGSVYVAPDVRGQGIARLMISRGLEVCARSMFKHIFILVGREHAIARKLYGGFGFGPVGELTRYRAPWTGARQTP